MTVKTNHLLHQVNKVSILMPVKNEMHFIEECLLSIQNQTYKNWEAIVVDDHSTDDTNSLIKRFSEQDKRFHLVTNRGSGIIDALKTAYDLADGEFVTRMDADDVMYPHKIDVLLSGLLNRGKGYVAIGGVQYFSGSKLKSGFINYENWLNKHTREGSNFSDIFKECVIPSPCWMLCREDLDEINAFNENRYPEDYDLAFRMYAKGFKAVETNEIIHYWRDHDLRASRVSENYKEYTFTALKWYYFNLLHRQESKLLVIMGTGYRGKKIAKHLLDLGIGFKWISNNNEKIGKHIYDQMVFDLSIDLPWSQTQCICAIANIEGKTFIEQFFIEKGGDVENDLFHFC